MLCERSQTTSHAYLIHKGRDTPSKQTEARRIRMHTATRRCKDREAPTGTNRPRLTDRNTDEQACRVSGADEQQSRDCVGEGAATAALTSFLIAAGSCCSSSAARRRSDREPEAGRGRARKTATEREEETGRESQLDCTSVENLSADMTSRSSRGAPTVAISKNCSR